MTQRIDRLSMMHTDQSVLEIMDLEIMDLAIMERLIVYGTDHRTVDPTRLGAVDRDGLRQHMQELHAQGRVAGFVVLSTCNRVEVYVDARNEIVAPELGVQAYEKRGEEAVRHLIRVAGSLESMVLGENQILGQVKAAWQASQDGAHCSSLLGELFRAAVRGARDIRNETGLGTRPVSVASLAVRHLVHELRDVARPRVAVIGAGTMARKAVPVLRENLDAEILVVNRTLAAAQEIAAGCGGRATTLEAFLREAPAVDGVFVAVRAETPVVDRALLERMGARKIHVADVCVPAATAQDVRDRPHTTLVDMDDLKGLSARHAAERRAAAAAADPIVDRHTKSFAARLGRRELGLDQVHRAHLELAEREADRILARELGHLEGVDQERLRQRLVGLAKAHAHLHLKDLKQKAAVV